MSQGLWWVVDIDIVKYFDSISHSHLRDFLDQRVTDGVIRRMIDKWLKAGVLEDGLLRHATEGSPQGGVISPCLSNIFLHHVLDEWFETEVRPRLKGGCTLVRFADDGVPRTHRRKEVRNCVRDGGRPSGAGRQGQASNHRKLRRSKAGVVSVAEKAGLDLVRYGSERRA
jgi:retron-type reverse transcriptase